MKKLIALLVALMMLGTAAAAMAETLTMGTNASFPPYEFYENEKIVGLEFKAIIPAVTTGKIDFGMAGMTVTEERLQSVNFSETYATGIQAIIVKEGSEIKSVDDLYAEGATWKVGVQESTTGDIYVTGDVEEAGLGTVNRYQNGNDAVMALLAGKVDCVVIDN